MSCRCKSMWGEMRMAFTIVGVLTCCLVQGESVGDSVVAGGSAYRCGPLALQVCAELAGASPNADRVADCIGHDRPSCTLAELDQASKQLGLKTLAVKWSN